MQNTDQIVTVVTNDGSGSQCGKTYNQRCEIAYRDEQGDLTKWVEMALRCNRWLVRHAYPGANDAEILESALNLKHYYVKHITE